MKKFNVGDIVYFNYGSRKGKGKILELNVGCCRDSFLVEMLDEYNKGMGHNGHYNVTRKYKGNNCWFVPMNHDSLKLIARANSESIHITRDGNTVHAILKNDRRVVKRTEVKCHPDDTFDFETGARIAFERLFNSEEGIKDKSDKSVESDDLNIEVGDYIKIVDPGEEYLLYTSWFLKFEPGLLKKYVCEREGRRDSIYKVVAKHPHGRFWHRMLYAIEDVFSHIVHLIGEPGIEKLKNGYLIDDVENFYGEIGTPTELKDSEGTELYVGDVVNIHGVHVAGQCIVVKDENYPFVMGIKWSCANGKIKGWDAIKVRSFKDLKDGEKIDNVKVVIK